MIEYGREGKVSKACDVYSFGVILMEIVTRKKPSEDIFGENASLRSWVGECLSGSLMDVVDHNLVSNDEDWSAKLQCVQSILSLAMNCTSELPKDRSNMKNVLGRLIKIREVYVAQRG